MQLLSPAPPPFLFIFLRLSPALARGIGNTTHGLVFAAAPEPFLQPLQGTTAASGEVPSGTSDTSAPISISTQDQESVTSNPVVTIAQSSVNPKTHNPLTHSSSSILQQASTSSNSVVSVIQIPNSLVAQSTSPTNYLTSSSSIPLTAVPKQAGDPMNQPPNSIFQRTSSSSTSAVAATQIPNKAAAQSTSSINDQTSSSSNSSYSSSSSSNSNPSQTLPSNSMLTDHPPAQIFPATTLAVSTVSSVPTAATSAVEPVDPISAGTRIIPPEATATPGKPANGTIQSGGKNGSATGNSVVTGGGSATESVSGHTSVPIVSTGGAEGVHGWENWWLGFGILVGGIGMVFWM